MWRQNCDPGHEISFSNTGSSAHLAAELFKSMAGINIVRIPYKGDGSAVVIFAPAKTPSAIINRLNREIVRFLNQPDTKQKFLAEVGADVIASSPPELAAWLKSELARRGKVIKDAGIRTN